jgi:membrane fusion protein, heavy metal efflux system
MNWRFRFTLLALCILTSSCSEPPTQEPVTETGAHEEPEEHHDEGVVSLSPETLERIAVRTARVERRALAAELETTGQVDFDQSRLAHVSPRIPGRVQAVRVELGSRVTKGQPLATLDSLELGQIKADYLQGRAREDVTRQTYEREKGLRAERISSEQEVLDAQAAHREATATLKAAEERLHLLGLSDEDVAAIRYDDPQASLLVVRAPFDGKVVAKHVTLGEMVTPERNLFAVADLSQVWVWVDIYERDFEHVHPEDRVRVWVDAFPDRSFEGSVTYLSDQVDVDTRTVRARIDAANPDGMLRPGMFARVLVSDPHSIETADALLAVPEEALQRDGGEFIVFVQEAEGEFHRREVLVGNRAGGWAEVRSGLALDELVVVEGAFLLKSELSKESLGGGHGH